MKRSRFVKPRTETLTISDGDTLTVRRRLTAGERRELVARATVYTDRGSTVDALLHRRSTAIAFLLDWSLPEFEIAEKSPNDIGAALDALDPVDYDEICKAIEQHEDAMDAERAAEKNGKDGENTSPAISPSPDSTAGATSGSAS